MSLTSPKGALLLYIIHDFPLLIIHQEITYSFIPVNIYPATANSSIDLVIVTISAC